MNFNKIDNKKLIFGKHTFMSYSGKSTMEKRKVCVIVSTCNRLYKLKYELELVLRFPFAINQVNKYMFSSVFIFS